VIAFGFIFEPKAPADAGPQQVLPKPHDPAKSVFLHVINQVYSPCQGTLSFNRPMVSQADDNVVGS
jgi:ABC-type iron transport system FetAB ATPase subunit